ncbi:MAG: hypothetical protein BZY79_03970 [SAR202 cluster bacterium Casp-Chloro-G4]|nr:methyltransferase domain-containing protein [Chloroflexota bacterium]PKB61356.1 MAG: hypothetical protein BZY79_03970 [SAR202 cluster bacterium Casp-Chloro-G4]
MADFPELNRETGEIWDRNADYWDERMGEGNFFQSTLIEPAQLRLLALQPGEQVLDIACGNGQFARKMASLGARVVASDVSQRMVELARSRTDGTDADVEYHVADATDETQLLALASEKSQKFDAVVCTMALMDIASIDPLISAAIRLLKPGGRFVFSVMHPCFNSGDGLTRSVDREELDGQAVERGYVKVFQYGKSHTHKGEAMLGQPVAQNYFPRSFSTLLGAFFQRGFVIDGMEEPLLPEKPPFERSHFEAAYANIPPALVARMRLPSGA